MQIRVDIVSQTTGRILLSSLLDAPSDGISRKDGWEVVKIMRRTQKQLEKKFGEGMVRLSLDSYEGTVFWYLVLFRSIVFDNDHRTLGGRQWSVYEMLKEESNAKILEMTNLGIVIDRENMWLALDWKEARKGILADIDRCPTWKSILAKQQRRLNRAGITEKVDDDYWKRCARSYSYTIPQWQLEKMGYIRNKMWHHGTGKYDDLIVLDMTGVDVPQLDDSVKSAALPVAKRVQFAHFYTEDPREYRAVHKLIQKENKDADPRARLKNIQRVHKQRNKRKVRSDLEEDKTSWFDASRVIAGLPKILGSGLSCGRYRQLYSGKQSDQLYKLMLDAYMNGEIIESNINKKLLGHKLIMLKNLLARDSNVPREFEKWINWEGKFEKIRESVECNE